MEILEVHQENQYCRDFTKNPISSSELPPQSLQQSPLVAATVATNHNGAPNTGMPSARQLATLDLQLLSSLANEVIQALSTPFCSYTLIAHTRLKIMMSPLRIILIFLSHSLVLVVSGQSGTGLDAQQASAASASLQTQVSSLRQLLALLQQQIPPSGSCCQAANLMNPVSTSVSAISSRNVVQLTGNDTGNCGPTQAMLDTGTSPLSLAPNCPLSPVLLVTQLNEEVSLFLIVLHTLNSV